MLRLVSVNWGDEPVVETANWPLRIAIAVVIVGLLVGLIFLIRYLRRLKRCHRCRDLTTGLSTGQYKNCPKGGPCCANCSFQHEADAEEVYVCPVDGTKMGKDTSDGVIADVCHGDVTHVLLSQGELTSLLQDAYDEGHAAGQTAGTVTGMVIGQALDNS